jgi:hypothetical protein
MLDSVIRRHRAIVGALVLIALAAPPLAQAQFQGQLPAQASLSARLLAFEDARELSVAAQAAFAEGMKSADPRIRAQAVRAAGRFETPAMLTQILPLLSDTNAEVRRWAAIATASSARIFSSQSIDALVTALGPAAPADWAVFAGELGRIVVPTPEVFARVEAALASGLPTVTSSAQIVRPARRLVRGAGAVKVEGAARGLEALTRVSGKVAPLAGETRSRLIAVVETADAPGARVPARARRLALAALRNAKVVDGGLARTASKDADDEVRRLTSPRSPKRIAKPCSRPD